LASKPVATIFFGLALKPMAQVSRFGPQNQKLWFGDLDLKITTMVSWFVPQNQTGFGLLHVEIWRLASPRSKLR
jgi:hypothetical protein